MIPIAPPLGDILREFEARLIALEKKVFPLIPLTSELGRTVAQMQEKEIKEEADEHGKTVSP